MQRMTSRFKRTLRRHQTGQAVVLLAIGFVVLLGFVGIVTDLSLLFVRYNALSRAIDSAAVAAAGQFSRKESDEVNFERTTFAARQFLEFHGIEPSTVLVDTCTSIPAEWDPNDTNIRTEEQALIDAELAGDEDAIEAAEEIVDYQHEVHDAVCDDGSGRKLVRVQASVEVPTTFMNLFGQETFTLTAAAVSETASLDVVIVLDVSESMLYDTSMDDYDYFFFEDNSINERWIRYLPANLSNVYAGYGGSMSQEEFRLEFLKTVSPQDMRLGAPDTGDPGSYNNQQQVTVDGYTFELAYDRYVLTADGTGVIPVDIIDANLTGNTQSVGSHSFSEIHDLRQDCRVQLSPAREFFPGAFDDLAAVDTNEYGADNFTQRQQYEALTGGFDRTNIFEANFRFYGCCNDPASVGLDIDATDVLDVDIRHDVSDPAELINNDFDFSDLVCQPFKQARDASTRFLYNVDFLAGDRVAIVTFDRSALILDPDGAGPEPPMMDDRNTAVNLLNRAVGVRAELNFYHSDTDDNGISAFEEDEGVAFRWTGYSGGIDPTNANYSTALDDADYLDLPVGAATRAGLVFDSCGFDNAAMPRDYSLWAYIDPSDGSYNGPSALSGELGSSTDRMLPPFRSDPSWVDPLETARGDNQSLWGLVAYERLGQCRGTNFGAALRQANNALLDPDTVRTEGAVWVIVLLSDGAAGATDPIPHRDGGNLTTEGADPYLRSDGSTNYNSGEPAAEPAIYGAYGFCPYGTSANPVNYASTEQTATACADGDPTERHYCYTEQDGEEGKTAVEINAVASLQIIGEPDDAPDSDTVCETEYDADDYARDWADYVALNRGTGSLTLLPTIFTIGFNLDYPDTASGACEGGNLQSCLGEELLRYIADVGDNNEFNEDYPSTFAEDRFAQLSYGNYWNAPGPDELADVFDEIAGRLFTRLTG